MIGIFNSSLKRRFDPLTSFNYRTDTKLFFLYQMLLHQQMNNIPSWLSPSNEKYTELAFCKQIKCTTVILKMPTLSGNLCDSGRLEKKFILHNKLFDELCNSVASQ